jgi:hypothetical protein
MADPALRALARRIKALEHQARQAKQPTLGFSTMDGGAIQATDGITDTLTMVMGEQYDGTHTAASLSGPTPPTPTMALAQGAPVSLRVYWDGTFAEGDVAPMDWARVTAHIVPLAEYDPETFTPLDQAHIYGSFESARGGEISATLEAGDYVVILVAWSQSGKFSAPSEPALGTVEAIEVDPGGTDGNAPAVAPNLLWTSGIGSVFFRWNQVPNNDPTEYALYVRAGDVPTTDDDTYLIASGNVTQELVREALGADPENPDGPEIMIKAEPGVVFYGIVAAYDDDGKGPDSMPAIGQSAEINSPDIATDAITTRHLQAESVGLEHLQAGSIDADKFVGRLILASEMLLGTVDNTGLDPNAINPNLLPTPTSDNMITSSTYEEGKWSTNASDSGWTALAEEFIPANDDPIWTRMAPGSVGALRVNRASDVSGGTSVFVMTTKVAVEPLTEYRFEFNSQMPGLDPAIPTTGAVKDLMNPVVWVASQDASFQGSEIISHRTFTGTNTPRPDLTKFDRGIIRTGAGQTELYLRVQVVAHYMLASAGGFVLMFPDLRKMSESTTVPTPVQLPASIAGLNDVTPDPTYAGWKASAVWLGGTTGATRASSIVTLASANGSFAPSNFSVPGRYAIPDSTTQSFQQSRGLRITTSSQGTTLSLRARIIAPPMPLPALAPLESIFLSAGFSGITQSATGLDDFTLTVSYFDESNALLEAVAVIDLDATNLADWGVTNLTENYFNIQLKPPVGAKTAVVSAEYSNGPSGNLVAGTNYAPTLHGLRLYTLDAINYNYGQMAARRVEIDSAGIRMVNAQGQIQINIPTDENEVPLFRGGIEAEYLRVFGGASLEGISEVAKDAMVVLSDGIKSPVGLPALTQEYEQYNVQRAPATWDGFSSRPTLNPSQITGMCAKPTWGEVWVAENRGGGSAVWRLGRDGTAEWAGFQPGWQWITPFDDPRAPSRNLFAGEFSGNLWAYVYSPTNGNTITNRIPDNAVPVAGIHPTFTWNPSNDRLYLWYPHGDGSGRNVYKRLRPSGTPGGTMVVEETVVGGSGTSRSSYTSGLAGAAIVGSRLYTAARGTTAADIYVFAAGSGGALDADARWAMAGNAVGFCHDGNNFWQIDTAGKLVRYSNWTWAGTNEKLFAGITWFDNDPAGTGIHETDLTKFATTALKKRISGVRVTLPRVPDKGGVDDPSRWRLYAAMGTSLSLPSGRTSMFLQAQGGSATNETTYTIPAMGLVTTGTNPPALNNFPSAGPGRVISAATRSNGDPLTDLRGSGEYRLAGKNLDDIGWTNIPLAANFSAVSGETPQVCLKNGVVHMRGRVQRDASWVAFTSYVWGTLPAGFEPTMSNEMWASFIGQGNTQYNARMWASSNGNLSVNSFVAVAAGLSTSVKSDWVKVAP